MEEALSGEVIRTGELEIHPEEGLAVASSRPLLLTVREVQLLTAMARRAERIVTREELSVQVWGRAPTKADRSVDVYVSKLRAKLTEALPQWRFIHTHFGIGYRFSPVRRSPQAARRAQA